MKRLDAAILGIFVAAWILASLAAFGWIDLQDRVQIGLRAYYAVAGGLGWIAGNYYRIRLRPYPNPRPYKSLLALYLGGTPSLVLLLFALSPRWLQTQLPIAPLLAIGIMAVFFAVPILVALFGPQE